MNMIIKNSIVASILVSLVGILIVLAIYSVPILNMLIFLWPVPMIVLAVRRGVWVGVLTLTITSMIVSLINPFLGMLIILIFSSLLLTVPYVIQRRSKMAEGIITGSGAALIAIVVSLKIVSWIIGQDIFNYIWEIMRETFASGGFSNLLMAYKKIGLIDEAVTNIQFGEILIENLKLLTPTILILTSIIYGSLNFLVSTSILRRMNMNVADIPKFSNWKLPRGTGRGFLVMTLIAAIGNAAGIKNLNIVLTTVSSLFFFIFSIQGLSVVSFYMERTRIPKVIRVIALIVIYIVLQMPLIFVGMFEQIFKFRGMHRTRTPNA